jgi:hypothetical protein
MEDTIRWEKDLASAMVQAKAKKKTVLVDFFNPG